MKNTFFNHFFSFSLLIISMGLMMQMQACGDAVSDNNLHSDLSNDTNTNNRAAVRPDGDFTEAARVATPAVVHINTFAQLDERELGILEQYLQEHGERGGRPMDEILDEEDMLLSGTGSGVIIRDDGLLVTSLHILAQAERIEVTLNDKRIYTAEIVGQDPATDLALLKIEDTGLPIMEIGNANELEVGEWIAAVGNPFGLTSTVTAGIVSAKGRDINILETRTDVQGRTIESYIQTDAAVNPGNSGGALINIRGELVGINAAIASPTGAFAGYSFAVPVHLVNKVVEDVMEFGEVRRGILGVQIRDIDGRMAEDNGIDDLSGVFVEEVVPNSPAAQAGIQSGDVILSIQGEEVDSAGELQEQVSLKRPGDEIAVSYRRNGQTFDSDISLGATPGP